MVISTVGNEVTSAAEDAARWNDAQRLRLLLASQLETAAVVSHIPSCGVAANVDSLRPALATAIANNSLEALTVLIDAIGVDTSVDTTTGWTGLHVAAFLNAELVAQLFVAKGANLAMKSSVGQTPVELATIYGNSEVLSVLAHPDEVFAKICACGADFIEDALFCRRCGVKRPVDSSFNPTAIPIPNPKPIHPVVMPWAISKNEAGTQHGVPLDGLAETAIQTETRTHQLEASSQCEPPVRLESFAQCTPSQTDSFAQSIPSPERVESYAQSDAPPTLVETSSQCGQVVSVDSTCQCSLPALGTCIETQTDPMEHLEVASPLAPDSTSLGTQTIVASLFDTVSSGAQTDSKVSLTKGSQCESREYIARSCQTKSLEVIETSLQCGAPWSCYADADLQVDLTPAILVVKEDASMQVALAADSADFGVQMEGPACFEVSTQCIVPTSCDAEVQLDEQEHSDLIAPILSPSPSPSMVHSGEMPPLRHSKPNKSWDGSPVPMGVSVKVVGVGREIVWRFSEHGATINNFKNEPVADLKIGDNLVRINDAHVAGLPQEQVMKLWKSEKGMSEKTTLHFIRRPGAEDEISLFPE